MHMVDLERREPHIGTVEDYMEVFRVLPLTDHERRLLCAHAHAEGRTMSAAELAHALGYESHTVINSLYGTLARKVSDMVGLTPKRAENGRGVVYTFALASGRSEYRQHWKWTMHPEVFEALRVLKIV
jgi:hypothetical protein